MLTTDNQKELFDLVNESDEVIGRVKRGDAHKNPKLIHRAIGILVFSTDGELFMQRRSSSKDTDPGKWSVSAAGHVNSGHTYLSSARRELREELGIKSKLTFVQKHMVRTPQETEINAIFKTQHNGPFRLHPEVISEGQFFSLPQLEQQISAGQIQVTPHSLVTLKTVCHILLDQNISPILQKIF